jgi:hypothetical protein
MTAAFVSHPVTRVALLDGSMDGLRQIDSFGSIIGVRAAAFSDLDRLKAFTHSGYLAYIIDAPRLYTGHGQADRKIGDRIGKSAGLRDSHVYLFYSRDERFNKLTAAYLEARLIDIAQDLGIPLANGTRPFGAFPIVSDDLEQLVQHAQILLQVAGFQRFEKARRSPPKTRRVAATGDLHDVHVVEPDQIEIPPDAVRKELVRGDLRAEGYQIGERFLVLAGSDFAPLGKNWLSQENKRRREAIAAMDIFEPVPGVSGLRRLTVALDCKTLPIAAKILTGEHTGPTWQVPPTPGAPS